MRYILLVLLAFVTTFASAQVQFLGSPTTTVRNRGNFVSDSLFYLPKRQVAPTDTAAMRYAISDSSVYVWTGRAWRSIGRAGASFLSVSDTSSMLSPYIRAAGNGLTKSGQSLLVDTASIATRARVQKAVDSLGSVKGSGTVTSVSAGNGMSFTTITSTGSVAADTLTLSTRAWRQKGDDSLGAIIATKGNGTVTSVATGYGLSGGTITTTGTLLVDTLNIATRAWRQKGIDSVAGLSRVGGSGTTNYVPKFTAASTIGNSQIFDNGTNVGIGTASPNIYGLTGFKFLSISTTTDIANVTLAGASGGAVDFGNQTIRHAAIASLNGSILGFYTNASNSGASLTERMRITSDGELLIGTTTDAGAYALQVAGSIYNTTGAVLAASSGNVGIGTASPSNILHVNGGSGLALIRVSEAGTLRGFLGGANGMISGYTNEFAIRGESGLILSGAGNAVNAYINSSAGELIIANGNTDAGDYKLQVAGNIYNTGNITTGAPTGGTATAWRLGEVATVSPTSPNRTIRVEIGSQVLYIHAKTTND